MRRNISTALFTTAVGAAALAAAPAWAQKSKDTLRFAFSDPIAGIDIIHDPKGETGLHNWAVFDRLLEWDAAKKKLVPSIAKTWKRLGPKDWEFTIREDLKWHDGQPVTADDVVYTLSWIADPKNKFRAKARGLWIANVEKTGPNTVRVSAKRPSPLHIHRLTSSLPIWPKHIHEPLKAKRTFGLKPIGTGPYRAVSVDRNRGIVLEKVANYQLASDAKPAGKIGRIVIRFLPDQQTQLAEMLTGGIDVLQNPPADILKELAKNPAFEVSKNQALHFVYLALDAKGRSGIEFFKNLKVRQAVFHAVNKKSIQEHLIPGGGQPMPALCLPAQVGCDQSFPALAHDLAKAKQLMSEAGYANGFEVELNTFNFTRDIAVAVAGDLSRIGIKSKIVPMTFPAYRTRQRQGKLNMLLAQFSMAGIPDSAVAGEFYFMRKGTEMYDAKEVQKLFRKSNGVSGVARLAALKAMLDANNRGAYILPISTLPMAFVHPKNVSFKKGEIAAYGAQYHSFAWK